MFGMLKISIALLSAKKPAICIFHIHQANLLETVEVITLGMFGCFVLLLCLLFQVLFLLRSNHKLRDLFLTLGFLFTLNSVLLLYGYIQTMQGATEISYLYIFYLNMNQVFPFFKVSLGLALVSFTLFLFKKIQEEEDK